MPLQPNNLTFIPGLCISTFFLRRQQRQSVRAAFTSNGKLARIQRAGSSFYRLKLSQTLQKLPKIKSLFPGLLFTNNGLG